MGNQVEPKKKKMSREALWTLIGLFTLSTLSAAFVLNFRIKMKKYQVTKEEQEKVLKEEQEFAKSRKTPAKNQ